MDTPQLSYTIPVRPGGTVSPRFLAPTVKPAVRIAVTINQEEGYELNT